MAAYISVSIKDQDLALESTSPLENVMADVNESFIMDND
jgi:hypothetical protein